MALSLKEAADSLGINKELLKNLIDNSKEINATRISRRIYIEEDELTRWKEINATRRTILTIDDYKKCLEFAFKIAYSGHTTSDFGTTRQRGKLKAISDWIQGALAEVALQKYLKKKFNVRIDLDFKVHGIVVGQDITQVQKRRVLNPPRIRVSIKSGKLNGCFLIVPEKEVDLDDRRSDYYVFVRIDFPEDHLIRILKDHPIIKAVNVDIPDLGEITSYICGFSEVSELKKVNSIPKLRFSGFRYVRNVGALHNTDKDWNLFIDIL
jgi:hypothetical protein